MTLEMGLCTTPAYIPPREHTQELNPPLYRSILYRLDDIDKLLTTNRPLIITLNNQCREVGGDWSGWDTTVYELLEHLKDLEKLHMLKLLGAGNEFDIYHLENGSVPPEFGADLARRTARIAHNYNIKVSATSVAGKNWQQYLQTMADLCRDDVDFFDGHFYGQRPEGWKNHLRGRWFHGELKNVVTTAQRIAQKPFVCTEEGVKIQDAGSEDDVASFMSCAYNTLNELGVVYAGWFAYRDEIGAPHEQGPQAFGIMTRSPEDRKRPAWNTYKELNMPPANTHPELDAWRPFVGKGLLDMMAEDRTVPAMKSEWRPFDRPAGTPATIEQCIGVNNVTYCYNLNTGSGWRIRPN